MKKRLLASFLALCLVLTLLPAAALADEGSPVEWSELTEAAKDSGGDTLDNTADEPDGPEAVDDTVETADNTELADAGETDSSEGKSVTEVADENGLTQAIKDGTVIKLTGDFSVKNNITIPANTTIELNLNGQTIDLQANKILVYGKLTIQDLTAEGEGKITSSGSPGAIEIQTNGSTTLQNGTIEGTKGAAVTLKYNTAKNNSFSMKGGTVTGTKNTIDAMGGIVEITGGSITTSSTSIGDYAIRNGYGYTHITIGIKNGNNSDVYVTSILGKADSILTINSGIVGRIGGVINENDILNGLFEQDITSLLPAGKMCEEVTANGQTYYSVINLTEEGAEAKIGETLYASAIAAAKAIKNNETLILLNDVVGSTDSSNGLLSISARNVTIDLNGYSVKNTSDNGVGISIKNPNSSPNESCDATIINSAENTSTITATIPVRFSSGNTMYTITAHLNGNIELVTTDTSTNAQKIELDSGALLAYSEDAADAVGQGGFKATEADGISYIYGSFGDAVEADVNKTALLLNDYTGNSAIQLNDGKTGTLDLGGHTYTYTGTGSAVRVNNSNTNLTVKNGTILSSGGGAEVGLPYSGAPGEGDILPSNVSLTLDAVDFTVNGTGYGVVSNGRCSNIDLTLQNGTVLNASKALGIYWPSGDGMVTIDNSQVIAHTGVQICAGGLTVKGENTKIEATGTPVEKTESDGGILDGAAVSIVKRNGYQDLTEVSIQDGVFESTSSSEAVKAYTFNNQTEGTWSEAGEVISISGGTFSSDPSAYVVEGKVALVQNNGMYTIADKNTEAPAEVVAGEPEVALGEGIPTENQDAVKNAVAGIDAAGLTGEANTEANNNTVTADQGKTALNSAGVTVNDADTVTIVVQPYLDITVTGYSANAETTTPNTMTLDITPMVRTVATTDPDNIELGEEGKNAVVMETAKELDVKGSITLTIPLPEGFAKTGKTVYIQHKDIYEYTAKVENGTSLHITFVNPHGFSVFTVSTSSAAVAKVGGTSYISLQAAVDAVKNNGTVTLLSSCDERVTVSRPVTFTLDKEGHEFTGSIVAGNGYTLTKTGDKYVVTRTPVTPVDPGDDDDNDNNNSGSTSVRRYNIEADAGRGGDISPDGRVRVRRGENQTFRISADDGWEIYDVEVDGESVGAVSRYTFENVRTDHTISATFRQIDAEPETPTLPFTDVAEGDWYHDAVAYCWENGIMDGTSGTTFAPNLLLNRAMMAQVLYNLADGTASTAAGFPDVAATAWYADAVNWAAANGYVTGYDNGSYGPEDSLTREQLAVILYRYAGSPAPAGTLDGFADAASASAYAVDALRWAVGEGLLTGKDGGRLDPTGTASRAELAQILARFAQM